jgi:hypothetical protein
MNSRVKGGRLPAAVNAFAVAVSIVSASSVYAGDDAAAASAADSRPKTDAQVQRTSGGFGSGTPIVAGPDGAPGFQGFGLGYHLGYGYGGKGFGVGPDGGYPFYSGPGYPHPWPCLNRFGHLEPFGYFGGPGYPTPDQPNFFAPGAGPLVVDKPVISVRDDSGLIDSSTAYGNYSGAFSDPEARFSRATLEAAAEGSSFERGTSSGPGSPGTLGAPPSSSPATAPTPPSLGPAMPESKLPSGAPPQPGPPATQPMGAAPPSRDADSTLRTNFQDPSANESARTADAPAEPAAPRRPSGPQWPPSARTLGADTDPAVDANGVHGMKVASVDPDTAAEAAGLLPGDVIQSANGYVTEKPGNIEWIIAHSAPYGVLKMVVRRAGEGQDRTITAIIR